MNNLARYNEKRKRQARERANAARHYGKTAVHVCLNGEEIERKYFSNYDDAREFVAEVNAGKYIKGASAFTNH